MRGFESHPLRHQYRTISQAAPERSRFFDASEAERIGSKTSSCRRVIPLVCFAYPLQHPAPVLGERQLDRQIIGCLKKTGMSLLEMKPYLEAPITGDLEAHPELYGLLETHQEKSAARSSPCIRCSTLSTPSFGREVRRGKSAASRTEGKPCRLSNNRGREPTTGRRKSERTPCGVLRATLVESKS